MTGLHRKSGQ